MAYKLVFYDFETTGLNPFHDKIIEYSFNKSNTNESLSNLVNPETSIMPIITKITNITNEMLQQEAPLKDHMKVLEEFLGEPNLMFVAHNGDGFDRFFLKRLASRSEKLQSVIHTWKYFDTIHMSKLVFPKRRSHSLKNLCNDLMISPGTHRAHDDTMALKELFNKMVNILAKQYPETKKILIENPLNLWNIIY